MYRNKRHFTRFSFCKVTLQYLREFVCTRPVSAGTAMLNIFIHMNDVIPYFQPIILWKEIQPIILKEIMYPTCMGTILCK